MQVFAVFGLSNPELVRSRLIEHYGEGKYLDVGNSAFLVSTQSETTYEVGAKIGFTSEGGVEPSFGIICPLESYWGYHSARVWEWLGVKLAGS